MEGLLIAFVVSLVRMFHSIMDQRDFSLYEKAFETMLQTDHWTDGCAFLRILRYAIASKHINYLGRGTKFQYVPGLRRCRPFRFRFLLLMYGELENEVLNAK